MPKFITDLGKYEGSKRELLTIYKFHILKYDFPEHYRERYNISVNLVESFCVSTNPY